MIGTDNACLSPPPRQTTWPTGEWGYSIRRPSYAGPVRPVRPEAVLPDRALYLPTFSHFLIVNKTSLSLRSAAGVPPWGTHGPGGVRSPWFFSLGWQVTRVSSYVRRPLSCKENRRISERDDLGPPVVSGGQEIVWDPETSILAHGEGL